MICHSLLSGYPLKALHSFLLCQGILDMGLSYCSVKSGIEVILQQLLYLEYLSSQCCVLVSTMFVCCG